MRYLTFLGTLPVIIILLSACSPSSQTTLSEVIPGHNKEAVSERKKIGETKTHPETADIMGKSVAVFTVVVTPDAPQALVESLHHKLLKRLSDNGLYELVLSDQVLNERLSANPKLVQAKEIYLDSLTAVSVSDKDISNPLGKTLKVENLLIFQLDQWPCTGCRQSSTLRMKLRLVDSESSFVLWTGIAEIQKVTQKELEDPDALGLNLADQLIDEFYLCFMKKWHRKRFDNLAKLAS